MNNVNDITPPLPDDVGICAIPTVRYPEGRTGTMAGYEAHLREGETTCPLCRKANADRSKNRYRTSEYHRAYIQQYQLDNRDRIKEYAREYYQKNKERLNAYKRDWRNQDRGEGR